MNLLNELCGLQEEDIIDRLKKETLPLVMWGAGSSAPEVKYYLDQNNILISDVFVDDEYYIKDSLFSGKPVLSYTDLKEKYSKVNVILGNSNYEKAEILKKKDVINNVYSLFSISYNVFEKTPLSEIEQYSNEFENTYSLLEDDLSKKNYIAFLRTRVSGNNKYITEIFEHEANFFNNSVFRVGENEVFLDVGAFDGDTIRLFLRENGNKYKYIYAIEPDKDNLKKLKDFVAEMHLVNVELSECGAWNSKKPQYFISTNKQISSIITSTEAENKQNISSIPVAPLDQMFNYKHNITLLKINYFEGVKEAIEGAKEILIKSAPKLVITIGFDCRNIRCIPALINKINPHYKFYLRFNRAMVSGLTLYAIVENKLNKN